MDYTSAGESDVQLEIREIPKSEMIILLVIRTPPQVFDKIQ